MFQLVKRQIQLAQIDQAPNLARERAQAIAAKNASKQQGFEEDALANGDGERVQLVLARAQHAQPHEPAHFLRKLTDCVLADEESLQIWKVADARGKLCQAIGGEVQGDEVSETR